jgi:serine/threonine-protein kinase BUR1
MAIERGICTYVPCGDLTIDDAKTRKRGSVYMVTPYMDHDLAGLLENKSVRLKVPHVKSYMKQLLKGTAYLHDVHPPGNHAILTK